MKRPAVSLVGGLALLAVMATGLLGTTVGLDQVHPQQLATRAEDAPALTDILHRAKASWGYPEEKMAEFRDYWRISEATIQSLTLTVAERDGQPIAFSGLSPQSEDTLLVDFLFVAPEAQRQGIGDQPILDRCFHPRRRFSLILKNSRRPMT